jgi:hypothetical protein
MKWDDFKNMPERLQVEYITRLQTKYGATAVDFAEMFGVGARSVRNYLSEHLSSVKLKRGKSMNAERRAEWMKFLGKDDAAVCDQTETNCNEAMQTEEVNQCNQESILDMSLCQSVEIPTESRSEPVDKDPSASNIEMKMTTLKMHFCGALDIDSIARRVKAVIGDNAVGELEIVCYMG